MQKLVNRIFFIGIHIAISVTCSCFACPPLSHVAKAGDVRNQENRHDASKPAYTDKIIIMNNSNTTAFDYKSSENNTVPNMPNTTNHQTPAAAGPSSSYVSVAKSLPKPTFPKKNQTIVLHAENSLKLFDYVKAIGDIIGAKHITFASKVFNKRICIYLSCPNDVDELLETNSTVNIKNLSLSIRRHISPTKRI
ncbi:hypothetical protein JTB14_010640 [Gonioctena quinquepunctata]|nr:hypothetical protein JTB14_010640 [Gonioctena quinquepunctata]